MNKLIVCLNLVFILSMPCGLSAETRGTILWYLEQEPGVDPYEVRYLVSGKYLRSDDGNSNSDFVLFDRKSGRIYNVVPVDGSILRMDGGNVLPPVPEQLSIEVLKSTDDEAPKMGGHSPLLLKLKADNSLCKTAIVAPGYLSDESLALRQFVIALATQQEISFERYPQEILTSCFLARSVYRSDFAYAQGLELVSWDNDGKRRELVRIEKDVVFEKNLFELPQGLKTYRVEDVGK